MQLTFPRVTIPWLHAKPRYETIGWIAMTGTILAGSTYSSFAKDLTNVFSPLSLVVFSEILTLAFVFLSFGLIPIARELFALPRSRILPLLGIGILSGTIAPLLIFTGLSSTAAVNATLFGNTEMLFLLLLATVFLHERLEAAHYLSLISITFGIVFIAFRGFTEGMALRPGDILLILASASFSVGDLIFRRWLHDIPAHTVIVGRSIFAVTGLSIIALLLPSLSPIGEMHAMPLKLLPVLLGFAFISRFSNIFCFYEALNHLPVSVISLFSNISIFTAIIFAHLFLGEPVYGYQVAGGVFIIFGTILLEVVGHHHPSEEHQEAHMQLRHANRV